MITITENIKIGNYSFSDGLNTSGVNSVYKDSKGFLWICANNGLFRYDGYSFKNINSLANGFLKYEKYCITEDKNHNFWIGTAGKGVVYYNANTGRLVRLNLSEGNDTKVNRILFHQGKIWMATNAGLMVIDENQDFNSDRV
jgi:ligand-binding sensor domain-containing protein